MASRFAAEDAILSQAEAIRAKAFYDAEARWKDTPDGQKERPWPRCSDITCNRTLVCKGIGCSGFDY